MLTICPSCLFVDYTDEFEISKEYGFDKVGRSPTKEINKLMDTYTSTKRFIMLAERLEKENAPKMDIADCYLKASWAERMANADVWFLKRRKQESRELEKQCQAKAVEYFLHALTENEAGGTPDLFYLIAELYRRTGNFSQAVEHFEKARKALLAEEYFDVVLDEAGEHWSDIAKEISRLLSIQKEKALLLVDEVPSKIFEFLEIQEAEEKATIFKKLDAKISIRKAEELPPESESLLILIEQMNLLALKKDGSHKVIEKL
jgi:tetratricopeptide (TPR) repeat protein